MINSRKVTVVALVFVLSLGSIFTATARGTDTQEVDRLLGIFDNQGVQVGSVSPQTVKVIERRCDRWLLIESWLGPVWLDLEFEPSTYQLNNALSRFGQNLSVFYKNIESGFTYTYNAESVYFGASVSKAMLALMIYQMAERDEICLDTTMTFQAMHSNHGSGIIQRTYPLGTSFTIRRLLELNLRVSDNVATLMLRDFIGGEHVGVNRYRDFIESIGGNPCLVRSRIMNSSLTANEAGIFAMAIHEYLESGGKYSEEFREHLLNNQYPFLTRIAEGNPPTASKTGWSNTVWHDMTIVYTDSPFILVVMSRGRAGTATGTERDQEEFAEIYREFLDFNNFWFPGTQ